MQKGMCSSNLLLRRLKGRKQRWQWTYPLWPLLINLSRWATPTKWSLISKTLITVRSVWGEGLKKETGPSLFHKRMLIAKEWLFLSKIFTCWNVWLTVICYYIYKFILHVNEKKISKIGARNDIIIKKGKYHEIVIRLWKNSAHMLTTVSFFDFILPFFFTISLTHNLINFLSIKYTHYFRFLTVNHTYTPKSNISVVRTLAI